MKKTKHCVADAKRQECLCEKCGETIPIPLGSIPWVVAVINAFCAAHETCKGPDGGLRTGFAERKT